MRRFTEPINNAEMDNKEREKEQVLFEKHNENGTGGSKYRSYTAKKKEEMKLIKLTDV